MQPLFISTSFYKISYFYNIPHDHFIKSLAFVISKQTHADEPPAYFFIYLFRESERFNFLFCFNTFFEPFSFCFGHFFGHFLFCLGCISRVHFSFCFNWFLVWFQYHSLTANKPVYMFIILGFSRLSNYKKRLIFNSFSCNLFATFYC